MGEGVFTGAEPTQTAVPATKAPPSRAETAYQSWEPGAHAHPRRQLGKFEGERSLFPGSPVGFNLVGTAELRSSENLSQQPLQLLFLFYY